MAAPGQAAFAGASTEPGSIDTYFPPQGRKYLVIKVIKILSPTVLLPALPASPGLRRARAAGAAGRGGAGLRGAGAEAGPASHVSDTLAGKHDFPAWLRPVGSWAETQVSAVPWMVRSFLGKEVPVLKPAQNRVF